MKVCGQMAKLFHPKAVLTFAIWRIIIKNDFAIWRIRKKEREYGAV
jgi:hypothetical protein